MMSKYINLAGMLIGSVGIFFGFYFLSEGDKPMALHIVTATTTGIVGILAFIRHVIFHKSDAIRLGWETDRPDWMFEVGFANLAFGVIGMLTAFAPWGMIPQSIVLLGYAIYLFQAAMLHTWRYFTDETKSPARLWRSSIGTFLFAVMMTFFALKGLELL